MRSDVTVVISNYNCDKFIKSCIKSVLGQSIPCKIIVVDDCSTDSSWKRILDFKNLITAVRLNTNSHGNARGKNIGIALSNTKYIACFDSDDMMTPHSIEYRLHSIEQQQSEWSFGFLRRIHHYGLLDYQHFKSNLFDLEKKRLHRD